MKSNNVLITMVLLISAIFSLPLTSLSQVGSLDLSFDTDGIVTTAIGTSDDMGYSIAIQPDGKIVVAGCSHTSGFTNYDFALVRYNINGSLDTTFDNDGKVTTDIGPSDDRGFSVAIQLDGKIVVAGVSTNSLLNYDIALVRYNTNGRLDTSFNANGIVTTAIGISLDRASTVAIQSDGKIVVAGTSNNGSNNDFAILRYNTNGSLDNTFDTDGKVTTDIGTSDDYGYSIVIQPDGKIVLAGSSNSDFALVRYDINGGLDTTFDADGKVTTDIGTYNDEGFSLAIQSDGKIVLAGSSNNGTNYEFALVRYNINGSLDNTFDVDGKVTTPVGSLDGSGLSVVLQSNGRIIVAGSSINGTNSDFSLVRYNTNGSLDNTFDNDGKVTTDIGNSDDYGYSVVIQPDGKIVVAGTNHSDFALTRYNIIPTGIKNVVNQSTELKIYPNPFSTSTTLEFCKTLKEATLNVYNIYGQAVRQITNITGLTIILNRDQLPKGMYCLRLSQNNKMISTKSIFISD